MRTVARMTQSTAGLAKARTSTFDGHAGPKPDDIRGEDSLILHKGQLLQTSKQRADGWSFGSVVFDPMEGRPPVAVDGISTQAGWFPLKMTDLPSQAQLESMQKMMGGEGAADALNPPATWEAVTDPLSVEYFTLPDGAEKAGAVDAFMKSLELYRAELGHVKVVEVQRVQNMSMWQSYAVKRQTVLERKRMELEEADGGAAKGGVGVGVVTGLVTGKDADTSAKEEREKAAQRMERVWLFHGTDEETVPKITSMGFNRSFCGKNATAYGKGVYFARDAGYSARTNYAKPNDNGVQHMFLVRVTIGEYCKGMRDALTPDVRVGHKLFDSTVNDEKDPVIFVTYHDAQAYPEYLIKFTQA